MKSTSKNLVLIVLLAVGFCPQVSARPCHLLAKHHWTLVTQNATFGVEVYPDDTIIYYGNDYAHIPLPVHYLASGGALMLSCATACTIASIRRRRSRTRAGSADY